MSNKRYKPEKSATQIYAEARRRSFWRVASKCLILLFFWMYITNEEQITFFLMEHGIVQPRTKHNYEVLEKHLQEKEKADSTYHLKAEKIRNRKHYIF